MTTYQQSIVPLLELEGIIMSAHPTATRRKEGVDSTGPMEPEKKKRKTGVSLSFRNRHCPPQRYSRRTFQAKKACEFMSLVRDVCNRAE